MAGFTLLELSIVLIIIGLIAGGILVGQDLINAAGERAQITQIEKYNQAVNTFRGKYNALPGDMDTATANLFGFGHRGSFAGEGDGNGIIEGNSQNRSGFNDGNVEVTGETVMFWSDLTYANGMNIGLIEGNFNTGSETAFPAGNYIYPTQLSLYYPPSILGNGNYVYVWSSKLFVNYFGVSKISYCNPQIYSSPGMTVHDAYYIDKKVDDGLPQTGRVIAMYMNGSAGWGQWAGAGTGNPVAYYTATSGSASTCFDNNGATGIMNYSIKQNNGSGMNCALSFQF